MRSPSATTAMPRTRYAGCSQLRVRTTAIWPSTQQMTRVPLATAAMVVRRSPTSALPAVSAIGMPINTASTTAPPTTLCQPSERAEGGPRPWAPRRRHCRSYECAHGDHGRGRGEDGAPQPHVVTTSNSCHTRDPSRPRPGAGRAFGPAPPLRRPASHHRLDDGPKARATDDFRPCPRRAARAMLMSEPHEAKETT